MVPVVSVGKNVPSYIQQLYVAGRNKTPFLGEEFGGTFPPKNVTHRLNPEKDRPWAEPRHLSHKAWILAAVRAGHVKKKKRTGKKSQELYFTYLWRSRHWNDLHQKLCSKWCPQRNHVCQVSKWNFQGLRFYRGSKFPFSYWFLNGPYNSAALLRCLWWPRYIFYARRSWRITDVITVVYFRKRNLNVML